MKRFSLITLAIMLTAFAGIALASPTRVKDKTGSISVQLPAGWHENRSGIMGAKMILFGSAVNGFATNINLIAEKTGTMSLSTYKDLSLQNAPKMLKGYKTISISQTKLGGVPALEWVYSAVMGPKDTPLKFKALIAIKNNTAYTLTFTALSSVYSKDVGAMDSVVKSLKWLK